MLHPASPSAGAGDSQRRDLLGRPKQLLCSAECNFDGTKPPLRKLKSSRLRWFSFTTSATWTRVCVCRLALRRQRGSAQTSSQRRKASALHVACGSPWPCSSAAACSAAAASEHGAWAEGGPEFHTSAPTGAREKPARMNVTLGNGTELSGNLWRSYYCSISQLERNLGPKEATYSVADKHIPWKSPYPLPELRLRAYLLLFFPLK